MAKITREQALAAYAEHGTYAGAGRALGVTLQAIRYHVNPRYSERGDAYRAYQREYQRRRRATDHEYAEGLRRYQRAYRRAYIKDYIDRTPERRERLNARSRERYATDPDYRARKNRQQKKGA